MNNFYLLLHATPHSYVRVVARDEASALRAVTSCYSPYRWIALYPEVRFNKSEYPLGEAWVIHAHDNTRVLKVS